MFLGAHRPTTKREQELRAWAEYLEAIRAVQHELRYDEVEAWAWKRLQDDLKRLRRKKTAA